MTALQAAFELRQAGYQPHRIMQTGLGRVEVISYPYPDRGGVFIKARREIGNPESVATFEIIPIRFFDE